MKRLSLLSVLFLFSANFNLYSQYVFKNFSAADGLSQHDVNCIIQDNDNFLWFGTNDGLNKYDGYKFTVFKPVKNSDSSISGRIIQDIATDQYGNLWIASLDGGLSRYNSNTETFDNFKNSLAALGSYANDIHISNDNVIWVKFHSKICYAILDKNIKKMVFHTISQKDIKGYKEDFTNYLFMKDGQIGYTSTFGSYVFKYKKSNGKLKDLKIVPLKFKNYIKQINNPFKNNWELHKNKVIYTEKDATPLSKKLHPSNDISAMDHDGSLWCVIANKLSTVSVENNKLKHETIDFENMGSFGLKNNTIKSIFVDKTGNLWIGTNGGGIYKKTNSNSNFKHYNKTSNKNSLSNNKIRTLFEDQFNNLWIGTEGGGVNFLDKAYPKYDFFSSFTSKKQSEGITSNNVFSITENKLNEDSSILWFSTERGGLNKLLIHRNDEITDFSFKKFNNPTQDGQNIQSKSIHSILSEGKNHLWIGYYGLGLGLAEWDKPTDNPKFSLIKPSNKEGQLSGDIIRDIYRDSFGFLWIATNNGLNKMNEISSDITQSTFQSYRYDPNDNTSISNNYTLQIFESSKKTLWIGTIGGGLNKMLRNKDGSVKGFKRFNKQNKLFPDDVVNSIEEDNEGYLWVGTNNELIKFDPVNETYDLYETNELQNPEMSEISALKRRNGEMVFGGINGINVFTPSFVKRTSISPKSMITDLSIMYEIVKPFDKINGETILTHSISHTDKITLKANLNNLSFNFSSLHFNTPIRNKYKYTLEGFDNDWIETSSAMRVGTYTNLSPGNYTFKVFGSNDIGKWSEKPAKVKITILPPWYLTLFAKISYIFAFILFFILLRKYTIIGIEKKKNIEYEHLEKEKEEEINQIKFQFFTNLSHEFRSPLTLISGPIEKLISQDETIQKEERLRLYSTMKRNSDYLLKLIKQLMDFRKLESGVLKLECTHINITNLMDKIIELFHPLAEEKKITLRTNYSEQKLFSWIDINKIEKILHNLLSNAVKFTPKGGRIEINITTIEHFLSSYPEGHLEIAITDTGKGIKNIDLHNIFTRFYQSDNQNKENDGIGIGLSYSQNLAKLHGGIIKVTSEEQKGSCFKLLLPLGSSHLSNEQMLDNQQIIISKTAPITNINTSNQDNNVEEYKNGDKPVLLVIEDNIEINHYLSSELSAFYTIISTMNGVKGLEVALEKTPNIIISDIMMPGLNGVEVCKKIKDDIRTSHIPIILLSAKTTDENKIEGLYAGADVYLTKPFNIEVLKTQIISLLDNHTKIQEEFKNPNLEPPKINMSSIDNKFIEDIIAIIKENIDNPNFTVQEFSNLSGMSRTTFFNKIKSLTGQKPTEFLRNYRLKLAAQYLEKGLSVKECMYKTGFNTPSYFTQSFKVLFKMTPTEYINRL